MSFCRQLRASLNKNYIEKKRNIKTTYCEYCSHFLILILLVFGYNLSDVLHFDAEIYSEVNVTIPPTYFISPDIASLQANIDDILSGPLPIPTFDQYITANRLITNAYNSVNSEAATIIEESAVGGRYANLYKTGSLHFAPDDETTDSLISYLLNSTISFSNMTYHKHASEDIGVQYILDNLDEYALALIVLQRVNLDGDGESIKYSIRQNYTTLPNTNQIVNWISIGLDTQYQAYLLSGFLTLQSTVDEWIFQLYSNTTLSPPGNVTSDQGQCTKPQSIGIPFPTAAYNQNLFYTAVGFLLGLAMTSKHS